MNRNSHENPTVSLIPTSVPAGQEPSKPNLLEQLRSEIRVRHYSIRTEESYTDWVRRFVHYHARRRPSAMGAVEINRFLSHLALDCNVAASTQNQACCALVFFYKHVLHRDIGDLGEVVHSKRPARLPVVLTIEETERILSRVDGTKGLMLRVLYGTGLRIIELIRLRVKEVDFDSGRIVVRDGKGAKDRTVMLPPSLVEPLRTHLVRVIKLHQEDLAAGFGTVYLPYALDRKYPNAATEWCWQYVFPSSALSVDPRTGVKQRHHVFESVLQKAIKTAVAEAGVNKTVHAHTFRHSFATHMLQSGADIRTVQELLGHKMGPLAAKSPLERLNCRALPPPPSIAVSPSRKERVGVICEPAPPQSNPVVPSLLTTLCSRIRAACLFLFAPMISRTLPS